jgi:DNA-binding transcriptional LysR family regulator
MPTRKALDKIFRDQGITVQHAQEFDNIELLKAVVALDSGVAIVPEGTVKQEVGSRTLAAVPLEGTYFRELGIIYKRGKVLSPAMKEFISMLQKPV